ncbi:MAG: hypothetical protein KIT73_10690, partial [Burkholderiales bacterium]|nr:hypothetical protein [Burkholderiales bacterium]
LALLPLGFLPWLLALPLAQHSPAYTPGDPPRTALRLRTLLMLWALAMLAFFTVSRSKLPGYILPAVPPLAMLAGIGLAGAGRRAYRELSAFTCVTGLIIVAIGSANLYGATRDAARAPYGAYALWIVAGGTAWIIGGALAWRLARRTVDRVALPALLALAMGVHGGTQLLVAGHNALRGSRSAYDLAGIVRPHLDPTEPFYSVRTFDHTLPFYLRKPLTLVDYSDELALGLRMEPWRGVPNVDRFEERWRKDVRPLALMSPQTFETLAARGIPLAVIARDGRRVVAGKPQVDPAGIATPADESSAGRGENARGTEPVRPIQP